MRPGRPYDLTHPYHPSPMGLCPRGEACCLGWLLCPRGEASISSVRRAECKTCTACTEKGLLSEQSTWGVDGVDVVHVVWVRANRTHALVSASCLTASCTLMPYCVLHSLAFALTFFPNAVSIGEPRSGRRAGGADRLNRLPLLSLLFSRCSPCLSPTSPPWTEVGHSQINPRVGRFDQSQI